MVEVQIKLAIRTLNEEYLLEELIRHYQQLGINHIYIFDCGSEDHTLDIINRWETDTELVQLVVSDSQYRHSSYQQQATFCNFILKWMIKEYDYTDQVWLFPDADEFVSIPSFQAFSNIIRQESTNPMFRTVFLDWYLPPSLFVQPLSPNQLLHFIQTEKMRGRISDLWGDPFYKDYVLYLTEQSFPFIQKLRTVAGFHRFIVDNKLYLPPNTPFLIMNHLRILPQVVFQERIVQRIKLVEKSRDDWSFVHFTRLKELIENYQINYTQLTLYSLSELEAQLQQLSNYNNSLSYYNTVIMAENIQSSAGSKPSMHTEL